MNCPFCGKEMQHGTITGDGRSPVCFEPVGKKIDFLDKMIGVGRLDVKNSLMKFSIEADYCTHCKKMIFDTDIAK
jgi:hypothetical protein